MHILFKCKETDQVVEIQSLSLHAECVPVY